MKAVFLHALGDALGSIGAMISGLGIWLLPFPQKVYLDPICSTLIAFILLGGTLPLVKNCVKILMQSVPPSLNLEEIESELLKVLGVIDIHEFHVWQLSDTKVIGTVHISCARDTEFLDIASSMKHILHKYGVHSTTIQPEFVDVTTQMQKQACTLTCLSSKCEEKLCCNTNLTRRAFNPKV